MDIGHPVSILATLINAALAYIVSICVYIIIFILQLLWVLSNIDLRRIVHEYICHEINFAKFRYGFP